MARQVRSMSEDDLRVAIGMWLAKEGFPDDSTYAAELVLGGDGDMTFERMDVTIETPDQEPRG